MMRLLLVLIMVIVVGLSSGCASKKYVNTEIEESESRTNAQVQDLKRLVEESQTEIRNLAEEFNVKIDGLEKNDENLSQMANDNAKTISQMKQLRFQKTLSDADATFKSDSAEINESAKEEIDKFAKLLQSQNRIVHLEIQGHTDSRGSEPYNIRLAQLRADAVRDYLYQTHDFPLHLMNTISFGSKSPVTDNSTREGRAQNRRVVLVVRMQL